MTSIDDIRDFFPECSDVELSQLTPEINSCIRNIEGELNHLNKQSDEGQAREKAFKETVKAIEGLKKLQESYSKLACQPVRVPLSETIARLGHVKQSLANHVIKGKSLDAQYHLDRITNHKKSFAKYYLRQLYEKCEKFNKTQKKGRTFNAHNGHSGWFLELSRYILKESGLPTEDSTIEGWVKGIVSKK